ncbi:head GIN domain-containing protein [Maribacter sp.]|uniref:head GIN domain-containing protein n=1 Tax=Maribacter sp. TaxID=1897614 RepID=UPI0025C2C22E|nr:head GIN domain-containing protein [Maribacter sp.]
MKKIAILSLSILMCSSCIAQWGKSIKGNGNVTTTNRTTEDYDAVSVSGWFDVVLVDGTEGKITIKGEENLLEYIITEVKDNKLVIKVEKGVNLKPSSWKDGIVITVPVESISAVALSGSGDIVGKKTIKTSNFKTTMSGSGDITLDINANSIDASMSGSGDINLSGSTNNFDATISGSGDIKAFDLEAINVDANISGSADIKITVKEKLKARVSGSGDITYKGNPTKVDTKVSGSGDISKG